MEVWLAVACGILHLLGLAITSLDQRKRAPAGPGVPVPGLSVIVAARNEASHLAELLPLLSNLSSDIPCEFILVLDRCSDGSAALVQAFADRDPRFRKVEVEQVPDGWAPKKWALTQGIRTAQYEHLVFTDADCRPEANWLAGMAAKFRSGAELVIGWGPYWPQPGLLNALVRYETFVTALLYSWAARRGKPFMAVGRNLGFVRSLWESVGGYSSHQNHLSGDDDLFVQSVAGRARVALLQEKGTRSWSWAEKTWPSWWRQKIRHLSTGTAYPRATTAILGFFHGLHAIFYLSLILVLCGTPGPGVAAGIFLIRTVLALAVLWPAARKWNAGFPLLLFPLVDLAYVLYQLLLVPASLLRKPKWKGD